MKSIGDRIAVVRKRGQLTKWLSKNDPHLWSWFEWMDTHKKHPDDEVEIVEMPNSKKMAAVFVLQDWIITGGY